jgi:hypothetical protein
VGAVETRGPHPAGRGLAHADGGEHGQADQHGHGGEVLEEAEHRAVADDGQGEGVAEQLPVGLGDGGEQDHEAPEGEEVGQPGDRPLEQLALAEDLDQLGPQAGPGALEAVGGWLAAGDQPGDPLGPLAGQGDREEGQHGPDGELHRTSSRAGGVRC